MGHDLRPLGITFRANTGDHRKSPAVRIAHAAVVAGAADRIYDPQGTPNARREIDTVEYWSDPYAAADDALFAVIATQ